MKLLLLLIILSTSLPVAAQNYTSYFRGNTTDTLSSPLGGICMMGGATENDQAMRWFLERASGGDILVLRASGSDGYNDYLFSELGVPVNSVETIVFNEASAADEEYIIEKINHAEAIWFAGGDQFKYVTFWRNTGLADLFNEAIHQRNIVIGGTSAGMAILGGFYFSASSGTVSSEKALQNPYDNAVKVDSARFIDLPVIDDVITDTHYDNPDRKGRHAVFLARILQDWGIPAKGIACEEYTAVCVEPTGKARVFGNSPVNDDNAYFIQVNCPDTNLLPETCTSGKPLTWSLNNNALKVYKVPGTQNGSNYFDLTDWETGEGGTWQNWYVVNGDFNSLNRSSDNCIISGSKGGHNLHIYPNPADTKIYVTLTHENLKYRLYDSQGKLINSQTFQDYIGIEYLKPGGYLLEVYGDNVFNQSVIIKN